jgi:hypothetical protein
VKLRLKRHNYEISATWAMGGITVTACFGVRAVPLNTVKALKIARVLYPGQRGMKVSIVNLTALKQITSANSTRPYRP